MRSPHRSLAFWLLALGLAASRGWAAAEPLTWEGTYSITIVLADGKPIPMGTEIRRYFPAEYEGRTVQAFESKSEIRLTLGGAQSAMAQTALSYSSLEHDPLYLETTTKGGGGDQKLVVRFSPERITYERTLGKDPPTTATLEVPEGISLRDPEIMWKPGEAPAGTPVEAWGFRPDVLRIGKVSIRCLGEEQVEVRDKTVSAFRVETDDELMGPSSSWTDADGMVLKQLLSMQGMKIVIELTDGADGGVPPATGPGPDLLLGSLVDCGGEIPDARACRKLTIEVSGIDRERLFVRSDRQEYGPIETAEDGAMWSLLTLTTEEPPTSGPEIGGPVPEDAAPYLAPSDTVQSADPEIVAKAREIVGEEKDSWKAALLIGEWTMKNVTPSLSESLLRSAKEVLANPRGECRSYSALYCGLARAAGIPCRMVAGAVYIGPAMGPQGVGRFGFHAWNEVWVGRWIAIDTAFPGPQGFVPVDATHIKFAEGDVADVASAARIVRSLKLKLVEADTQAAPEAPAERPAAWPARWRDLAMDEVARCARAS